MGAGLEELADDESSDNERNRRQRKMLSTGKRHSHISKANDAENDTETRSVLKISALSASSTNDKEKLADIMMKKMGENMQSRMQAQMNEMMAKMLN